MKNNTAVTVFVIWIFLICGCTNAPDSDKAQTADAKEVAPSTGATLQVDTSSSKIEWVATKVSGYHTGTVNLKGGQVNVTDSNITSGTLVMDMKSIVVSGPAGSDEKGNAKLLKHLKSADFFDVDKNPEASFVITEVKPFAGALKDSADPRQASISKYKVADPTHLISGNLTIKGITKNIEFPAQVTVSENTVESIAKFNIDRTEWNIVYPGQPDDLIRNDIHFGISIKANK